MKIYNEDQLIAYSEGDQIILVEGTPENLVPIEIFGCKALRDSNKASIEYAKKWLKNRAVPESRMDIDKVLDSMGLEIYNAYDIIRATKGRAFGDKYSVELKEGEFQ